SAPEEIFSWVPSACGRPSRCDRPSRAGTAGPVDSAGTRSARAGEEVPAEPQPAGEADEAEGPRPGQGVDEVGQCGPAARGDGHGLDGGEEPGHHRPPGVGPDRSAHRARTHPNQAQAPNATVRTRWWARRGSVIELRVG